MEHQGGQGGSGLDNTQGTGPRPWTDAELDKYGDKILSGEMPDHFPGTQPAATPTAPFPAPLTPTPATQQPAAPAAELPQPGKPPAMKFHPTDSNDLAFAAQVKQLQQEQGLSLKDATARALGSTGAQTAATPAATPPVVETPPAATSAPTPTVAEATETLVDLRTQLSVAQQNFEAEDTLRVLQQQIAAAEQEVMQANVRAQLSEQQQAERAAQQRAAEEAAQNLAWEQHSASVVQAFPQLADTNSAEYARFTEFQAQEAAKGNTFVNDPRSLAWIAQQVCTAPPVQPAPSTITLSSPQPPSPPLHRSYPGIIAPPSAVPTAPAPVTDEQLMAQFEEERLAYQESLARSYRG